MDIGTGTIVVPGGYHIGTKSVPVCHHIGTKSVPIWWPSSILEPFLFLAVIRFVPNWLQLGTIFVPVIQQSRASHWNQICFGRFYFLSISLNFRPKVF